MTTKLQKASRIAQKNMDTKLEELKVTNLQFYRAYMMFRDAVLFTPNKLKGGK